MKGTEVKKIDWAMKKYKQEGQLCIAYSNIVLLHHALTRLGFSEEEIGRIMNEDMFLGNRAGIKENKIGIKLDAIPHEGFIEFMKSLKSGPHGRAAGAESPARGYLETIYKALGKDKEYVLRIGSTQIGTVGLRRNIAIPESKEDVKEILERGPFVFGYEDHALVAKGLEGEDLLVLDTLSTRKSIPIADYLKKTDDYDFEKHMKIMNHYEIWPRGRARRPLELPSQIEKTKMSISKRRTS